MLTRLDRSVQTERRTQEQLRRFLGDASHELRSPLTALVGYDDLLLHHPEHADTASIAGRMRRELFRRGVLTLEICPNCGHNLADDRVFCRSCAYPMRSAWQVCPVCAKPVQPASAA